MDQTLKATKILEGEASESDEEISDYHGFVQNTMVAEQRQDAKVEGPSSSVVVSGEASESDDEIGDYILQRNFPSLETHAIDDIQDDGNVTINTRKQRRFESPFHKKIWESNFAFRLGIVQIELEKHNYVTNRLGAFVPIANRSLSHTQETLKQYRKLSEVAKDLSDNLENVLKATDLPELNQSVSLE